MQKFMKIESNRLGIDLFLRSHFQKSPLKLVNLKTYCHCQYAGTCWHPLLSITIDSDSERQLHNRDCNSTGISKLF